MKRRANAPGSDDTTRVMPIIAIIAVSMAAFTSSGCSCEGEPILDGTSSLATDTKELHFGRVFLGASARRTFVLSAPGTRAVGYTTRFDGNAFGYQVGPAVGRIAANASVEIVVVFRPARAGDAVAAVLIASDATKNASIAVALSGTGVDLPDCEDGNGCTLDHFDLEAERCLHEAMSFSCDDLNACTVEDTCVDAICLGGSLACDDNDACTDDLCDQNTGCVHVLRSACNDRNPCTADRCEADGGCTNETLPDGTPCDDLVECTIADICIFGQCIGVNVPEGTACDDGLPCSHNDQCIEGRCQDPTHVEPTIGEVRFATDVGPLADGASENPIVDRDSTVFIGIEGGVAAVDLCGEILWTNRTIGTPRWSGAVALPGVLSVPVGSRIVDLESRQGNVIRSVDLAPLLPALPFSGTSSSSSTATTTVRVLDLAVRASGALLASVLRETNEPAGGETQRVGLIAEVDAPHAIATSFRRLGSQHATRLAVDQDEAVLAVIRDGPPTRTMALERLVRFGIEGLPETSWSTSFIRAEHTELALGEDGEAYWTSGLLAVTRKGDPIEILAYRPDAKNFGSPIVGAREIFVLNAILDIPPRTLGNLASSLPPYELLAIDARVGSVSWRVPLMTPVVASSPALDLANDIFLITVDGTLHGYTGMGVPLSRTALPLDGASAEPIALGISPEGDVIAATSRRVIGVRAIGPLSNSPWPRHRRDNLATGHR